MGHQASGRAGWHQGSAIGAHYRHTTPEMATRLVAAVEERLAVVLATAEVALDQQRPRNADSVRTTTRCHLLASGTEGGSSGSEMPGGAEGI
jgi:hypothetical protein